MTPEQTIQREILLACGSLPDVRLFRNNVGTGWTGEIVTRSASQITLKNPRPLHAGLFRGSADLIGWRSLRITPHDIGRRVAVLVSLEVKTPRGRPTAEQENWFEQVARAGGIAAVVRSVEESLKVLEVEHG